MFILIEGKSGYRQYLWVFRTKSAIYYVLDPTRSARVPISHFKGVEELMIIVCDRYSACAWQNKVGSCWRFVGRTCGVIFSK